MAQIVDGRQSTFHFLPDSRLQSRSRPQTPPYTPARGKLSLGSSRAASPASSIHPTETTSPPKKLASKLKTDDVLDTVRVEELTETEIAFMGQTELILPSGFEEYEDIEREDIEHSDGSESDAAGSDAAMAHKLSQLYCEDASGEAEMRRARRQRRLSKRAGYRIFKRSHSQSVKSDSEVTDTDARDDHDLSSKARRLRRRVNGPNQTIVEMMSGEDEEMSPEPVAAFSVNDKPLPFVLKKPMRRRSSTPSVVEDDAMEVSTEAASLDAMEVSD